MVRTTPSISEEELGKHLKLSLPGFEDLVSSDGYGQFDDGDGVMGVSFGLANSSIGFNDGVREAIKSTHDVDIFWGEDRANKLATVPCECAPIEDDFIVEHDE